MCIRDRFRITGRTRQYINAFGEELIVDNADRAMAEACRITRAKVTEYTAAPIYFDDQHGGAHEWLIEFEESPADMDPVSYTHLDVYKRQV